MTSSRVLVALLCFTTWVSVVQATHAPKPSCKCPGWSTRTVSLRRVVNYTLQTKRACGINAVVFNYRLQGIEEGKICSDPNSNWAKKVIRKVNKEKLNRLTSAASPEPPHQRRLTRAASPAPPHQSRLTSAVSPAPPHQRRLTSAASPEPSHQLRLTSSASPEPPHQRRLTSAASPAPPHQRRLTRAVSPAPPHQLRLTRAASPAPPHQRRLTSAASPAPPHQSRLTSSASPAPPHQSRLTRAVPSIENYAAERNAGKEGDARKKESREGRQSKT
ncbi:apidaecins type 73-like isoform X2 [Pungitius pungitius]|uniref:apidaecins type 73-like isoform X1 n=1 Tax=Pungitius pungitius TaxID=134920 RepID=UPI002E0D3A9B